MNKAYAEKIIFVIAFIEGAAVMGIELAGVKIIAPIFGTTLYVWAAVLSVTLGGLALGYFLGGTVASRFSGLKSTPLVLLIGAVLIALMPFSALAIMTVTADFGIRFGALLSAAVFLMPPLICMGMISPILIQLKLQELKKAGRIAGTVYAVSTTGGILMTLLMGLAGGNLAMELKGLGFNVDAVELDKRMPFIAEEYFGFTSDSINIIIDDSRHYINNTDKMYDVIIIDVLTGEVQPHHLFTVEAMENMKIITHSNALVMFNFQGFITGKEGLAARSIYKTLLSAGFKIKYNSNLEGEGKDGDILFIASPGEEQNLNNINESRLNLCCKILAFEYSELITNEVINISDASIFTDNKPLLDKMNLHSNENWRLERIESYSIHLAKNSFSLFN